MFKNRKNGAIVLIVVGFVLILVSSYFKVFSSNNILTSALADAPIGAVLLGIGVFALLFKPK